MQHCLQEYPSPALYPQNNLAKALDRKVVEEVSSVAGKLFKIYMADLATQTKAEKLELFNAAVSGHLVPFEEELKSRGTTFLFGSTAGMADYMIWPFIVRMLQLPFAFPEVGAKFNIPESFRCINAWIKAMQQTEPVKQYSFLPRRSAAIYKIYFKTWDYDKALAETSNIED